MNKYGSGGFSIEEISQIIEEKEREIVHLECEVEDCREDLRMLQLELARMEE